MFKLRVEGKTMFFMQFTLSDNRKPFFCGKKKVKFFFVKKRKIIYNLKKG